MKILLQSIQSKQFFTRTGRWTRKVEEALVFANSLDAMDFARTAALQRMQIVFKFSEARYDLVLPVVEDSVLRSRVFLRDESPARKDADGQTVVRLEIRPSNSANK